MPRLQQHQTNQAGSPPLRVVLGWTLGPSLLILLVAAITIVVRYSGPLPPAADPPHDRYPVRGIDISAHNGRVDFDAVRNAGYAFVMIKATEGAAFNDRMFARNYANARNAGLAVGVYHFFRFDADGYMQALNLANALKGRPVQLPVVIDLEEWTNPEMVPTDTVVNHLRTMLSHLRRRGYRTMLYTNKQGHRRFVQGRLEEEPLWLCSLSGIDGADTPSPALWQYSHRGSLEGVDGPVDLNVFCGDTTMWCLWAGTEAINVPYDR